MKITEENKNLYQTLYSIKKGEGKADKSSDLITAGIIVAAVLALTAACVLIVSPVDRFVLNPIVKLILGASIVSGAVLIPKVGLNLNTWLKINKFKKDHPEIETNITTEKLEKELTKYNELIERQERLKRRIPYSNALEKPKKMTSEERIRYLEREKEFLKSKEKRSYSAKQKHL